MIYLTDATKDWQTDGAWKIAPAGNGMNNVDKAMGLASKMMRDSWATGNDADWQPAYQSLRTHLEAMEADRVGLLEALKFMLSEYSIGPLATTGEKQAHAIANSSIAQSKEQS